MIIKENYSLQAHHTFHLPIKSRWYIEYESIEELKKNPERGFIKKTFILAYWRRKQFTFYTRL